MPKRSEGFLGPHKNQTLFWLIPNKYAYAYRLDNDHCEVFKARKNSDFELGVQFVFDRTFRVMDKWQEALLNRYPGGKIEGAKEVPPNKFLRVFQ